MTFKDLGPSHFIDIFGDSPINWVLDFFVVNDDFDYSMSDINKHTCVSYSTLKTLIPKLEKKEILIKTRISGKSPMYKLNKDFHPVKQFIKFYWSLTEKKVIAKVK